MEQTNSRHTLLIGILGAYLNTVVYGFQYGTQNHEYELAAVNWFRDASLYPNDLITGTFARYPAPLWRLVAWLSRWWATEHILMALFAVTKVLFFVAVARLVSGGAKKLGLVAVIVSAVALSPLLNQWTPFGGSDVLNSVQTNTSLAIALLLWSGLLLIEGRWIAAAVAGGISAYLNGLFLGYTLFAFLIFACVDWRKRKGSVLLAALVGAAISVPWLFLSRSAVAPAIPRNYVLALLTLTPAHLTLRGHDPAELVCGAGLIAGALLMVAITARSGLPRQSRLELLAASYLIPVAMGALAGEFFLTPRLARLQLLRADSFLVLYSLLLIGIYGANLLLAGGRDSATNFLVGETAIFVPLSDYLGLLWPLFAFILLWTDPRARFERFLRTAVHSWKFRAPALSLAAMAAIWAGVADASWTSTVIILLVILGAWFLAGDRSHLFAPDGVTKLTGAIYAIAALTVVVGTMPRVSSLWNPHVPLTAMEADWLDVQQWAKANAPSDAHFLVPTHPCGFRVFSDRPSWGEWKDGNGVYWDPGFAETYLSRMEAVGLRWTPGWHNSFEKMQRNFKKQTWKHLLAIARENHLSYIIQFRDVPYPVEPVFANQHFAVYRVPQE